MASEDVIELGSSDDEAEPAPKKRKPLLNAMVHIPSKLPGITIKPAKLSSTYIENGELTKPIIIKKNNIKPNPITSKLSGNGNTIRVHTSCKNYGKDFKSTMPVQNKTCINPLSVAKSLSKTQLVVKKVHSNKRLKNPIGVQGQKMFNNLPPGITIKPVYSADVKIRPAQKAGGSGMSKKWCVITPKTNSQELLTVEIDDEDANESANASPLWYLRPEEQNEQDKIEDNINNVTMEVDNLERSMEEKNNKEPETKYVEIIIEDSPIKSILSKHQDIGKELTITIDDSPVKPIMQKTKEVKSEDEMTETAECKGPHSKKKLDYPKENKHEGQVVEIEIDLKESDSIGESEKKSNLESPEPKKESVNTPNQETEPHKISSDAETKTELIQAKKNNTVDDDDEFHPIYQNFIQMCFELEDTEDMEKIVEKKIKAYYRQCPKEYVESEEFTEMVSSKIISMKAAPEKMYLYIKDIVDELNLQRKMIKSVTCNKIDEDIASSDFKYEENQCNSKKRRQIRKLEKTIKKLHRAIQKLEEQEVEFDDDEDSVYLLTERYKERMVRVHAKFCQLTNTKMPSEPRIHIEARPGQPLGPAKKLEKWINKKVPIGTPLPFPDFHDVLRCVRDANEEDKLEWNDIDIMEEARDLFTRCGKKLQRRRQENEWRIAASRIPPEIDPAESSEELKRKLNENKTIATKKETDVLNKYVDRQNQLKLVAEEIGDKEAEESPVESGEEEEVVNINPLEDKQKRKQRLKRLIKEKSKKDEAKENDIINVTEENKNKNETEEMKKEDIVEEKMSEPTVEDKSTNSMTTTDPVCREAETIDMEGNSNDSNIHKVESDIDELHLLQKLHSENEANTSTHDSSDSETPIAISDTLESDSEVDNGTKSCDVISIENSSYSESESTVHKLSTHIDSVSLNSQNFEILVSNNFEIEYSSNGVEEINNETAINENTTDEIEENILLASSDDEDKNKPGNREVELTCINLRDDNISISETTIDGGIVEDIVSSDGNSIPENNNAVEVIEGSSEVEEYISTTSQLTIEDSSNLIEESPNINKVTDDENELHTDIVDIKSLSDVFVATRIDLETDIKSGDGIDAVPTSKKDCILIKDLADSNINCEVQDIENLAHDTIMTNNFEKRMEVP